MRGKLLGIELNLFPAGRFRILRRLDLFTEDHVGRAGRAHDRNLRGGPGVYKIRAQILGAHGQIGAAIGLAQHHGQLGHLRHRVDIEQLGSVADDAGVLLVGAGQEARYIHQVDQRNSEGIAELDEAGALSEALMSRLPPIEKG